MRGWGKDIGSLRRRHRGFGSKRSALWVKEVRSLGMKIAECG